MILDLKMSPNIKKSRKFDGAHTLSTRTGHFFLKDAERIGEDPRAIAVPYAFYDRGQWREDHAYFTEGDYAQITAVQSSA